MSGVEVLVDAETAGPDCSGVGLRRVGAGVGVGVGTVRNRDWDWKGGGVGHGW